MRSKRSLNAHDEAMPVSALEVLTMLIHEVLIEPEALQARIPHVLRTRTPHERGYPSPHEKISTGDGVVVEYRRAGMNAPTRTLRPARHARNSMAKTVVRNRFIHDHISLPYSIV